MPYRLFGRLRCPRATWKATSVSCSTHQTRHNFF